MYKPQGGAHLEKNKLGAVRPCNEISLRNNNCKVKEKQHKTDCRYIKVHDDRLIQHIVLTSSNIAIRIFQEPAPLSKSHILDFLLCLNNILNVLEKLDYAEC